MPTNFVSLHNQTSYSLLDSLIEPKELFKRVKELEQTAVAIADHGVLGAAYESLKASRETGVKLIIGCECYFVDDASNVEGIKFRHLVLLAKNAVGYRNLLTINKKGFDQGSFIGKRVYPIVDWKLLEQYADGLICLTACGNGIINQLLMNKKFDQVEETISKLKALFGDNLGLEVQPNNMKRGSNIYNDEIDQQFLNRRNIELGKKHNIKVVPACNAHYLKKEDHETHDVFLAIGSHQPVFSNFRLRYSVPEFYLKTGDEVKAFFSRNYGEEMAQQMCDNTIYFADLCEFPDWIEPKYSNPTGKELPIFPVKDEPDYEEFRSWVVEQSEEVKKLEEDKQFLRYHCQKFFNGRLPDLSDENKIKYQERLEEELDVMEFHGFSSYMLIVADFIGWARKNNIAVGAGRGSVGGSLIGFLLNIHQADPIKYNLIFARFHNKEKSSFPDVDIDFAPSGRSRVQQYLRRKYGQDHVAHVSNTNTITPKVYVRDIARACELGGSREKAVEIGNFAADCIPVEIGSMNEAINKIPLFGEYCKKYPEFVKYKAICGKSRAASTHAGGIVVSARPLTGLVPVRKDKDGDWSVEYDKDKAEENGLVKIDTLGLSTLDIITQTYSIINSRGKELPPDNLNYDTYDEKTYDLISKGDTYCVFQLGTSGGTIELCRQIKPKSINDISLINSLARPSAREMRKDFILTKDGKKPFTLLHPKLGRAFNNTFGFGLYEESLMYLAQDIAGWSLHSADRLRKLTKEKGKNPKKVQQWRSEFISDAIKNDVSGIIAQRIWDETISLFGGYGFNFSHSILYSMISYKTAYLKAHFPIEFLLANLMAEVKSASLDARPNIAKLKNELRAHKVKILKPDLNISQLTYTINGNNLLTGLDALKFVSDDAIKDIIAKRPFKDFFDFMARIDSKKVRSNSIQALASAGALDSFKIPRKLIFLYVSDYRKKLQIWLKKHDPLTEEFIYPWPKEADWQLSELYALEQFYLGEAFVCKPYQAYKNFFNDSHKTTYDIKKSPDKTKLAPIKGIIRNFFEFKVKKETSKYYGQSMIKAVLEDKNGDQCGLTIFPDRWKQVQDRLKEISSKATFDVGIALSFGGNTNIYEDNIGVILDNLFDVAIIPALPADLKAKKINLKEAKAKLTEEKGKKISEIKNLSEKVEDSMYDEGLIDFNESDENSETDDI
jgi:DNA polymerase III subunit alpha